MGRLSWLVCGDVTSLSSSSYFIRAGGGVLAYTILGIYWNEHSAEVYYLILDPHYTGSESLAPIQKKWCKWHPPSIFRADVFYNLCMPQRPKMI